VDYASLHKGQFFLNACPFQKLREDSSLGNFLFIARWYCVEIMAVRGHRMNYVHSFTPVSVSAVRMINPVNVDGCAPAKQVCQCWQTRLIVASY